MINPDRQILSAEDEGAASRMLPPLGATGRTVLIPAGRNSVQTLPTAALKAKENIPYVMSG